MAEAPAPATRKPRMVGLNHVALEVATSKPRSPSTAPCSTSPCAAARPAKPS